jgi:tetratricopeptide (TPR) repeat protein
MTLLAEISSIQRLAQNACYTEGLEFYQQLSTPSAADDRWAGHCLWHLGRLEEARLLFSRAKHRGEVGALLGLASVCRLLGLLDDCEANLDSAFDSLSTRDDFVRAIRERGELHIARNNFKAALEAFTEARLEAELHSETQIFISYLDQSLGSKG